MATLTAQPPTRPQRIAMPITKPPPAGAPNQRQWNIIFNCFPYPNVFGDPSITVRLQTSAELQNPDLIRGDSDWSAVNAFLQALNTAFPRTNGVGPTTHHREVVSGTASFPRYGVGEAPKEHYHTAKNVKGYVKSAYSGWLILCATGSNLDWSKSNIKQSFDAEITKIQKLPHPSKQQITALETQRQGYKDLHDKGEAPWHCAVVYLYRRQCFIYDPSAFTFTRSQNGQSSYGRVQNNHPIPGPGVISRCFANLNTAWGVWNYLHDTLFKTGISTWIGGGGNVAQAILPSQNLNDDVGECRAMACDFIVVCHVLQWIVEVSTCSEQTKAHAQINIDWLLGYKLSNTPRDIATPQWEPVDVQRVSTS